MSEIENPTLPPLRKVAVVAGITLLVVLAALGAARLRSSIYSATACLLVEKWDTPLSVRGLPGILPRETNLTRVQDSIASRDSIRGAVAALLQGDFSGLGPLREGADERLRRTLEPYQKKPPQAAMDALLTSFKVQRSTSGYRIRLHVGSPDPVFCAALANTIFDRYIKRQVELRGEELNRAVGALANEVLRLEGRLEEERAALPWNPEAADESHPATAVARELSRVRQEWERAKGARDWITLDRPEMMSFHASVPERPTAVSYGYYLFGGLLVGLFLGVGVVLAADSVRAPAGRT